MTDDRLEAPAAAARVDARPAAADYLLFLLIALVPAIFALCTWDTGRIEGGLALRDTMRRFSMPVVAIETLVILYAMASGFEPLRAIRSSPRWMQAALGLLFAIAFATALLVAPDRTTALARTCTSAIHLLFGLGVAHLFAHRWSGLRARLWPAVALGACVYLLILALFVAAIEPSSGFDWRYLGLGVVNVRQLGFYAMVGGAAAFGLAATDPRPRPLLLWTAAASLFFALSFWSGTRGSVVAVFASVGLGLATLPIPGKGRLALALLASLAAGAALSLAHWPGDSHYGLLRMVESSSQSGADAVSSGRIEMWLGTLEAITRRPLFGFGESQFALVVPESLGAFNHPHNILLQILLQWGLVGALCFFALAASLWWKAFRLTRAAPAAALPAFFTVNALLVFALYEGSFYHPYPVMMITLALAAILAGHRAPSHHAAASPIGPRASAVA